MSVFRLGIFCCLALPAAAGTAGPQQAGPWELDCTQERLRLICDYRAVAAQAPPLPAVDALLVETGTSLPVKVVVFPGPGEHTAILFLVDTSDPRRKAVVAENARQVQGLVAGAPPHRSFGLAAFDKGVKPLAPLGAERSAVLAATDRLRAEGKVTELYRSAITALEQLADFNARRKALVIFSDGLAEDTAYTLRDVVDSARAARVAIIGVGYARSSAQVVGLQSLRRLARETGGYFIEAGADLRLPADFMAAPFVQLERGGGFILDLGRATSRGAFGEVRVRILLGPVEFLVPVSLPPPPPPQPQPEPPPAQPVIVVSQPPTQQPPEPVAAWRSMSGWLPALLVLLLMLVLLRYRERLRIVASPPPESMPKPLAWLEDRVEEDSGGESAAYPVTGSPWRIGRAQNNDLVLSGDSISRHHAEILYSGAGRFRIADLGALNGIFVNGAKVSEAELKSGDRIDVGDYSLHFSLDDPAAGELQEQTVMAHTQVPEADADRGKGGDD